MNKFLMTAALLITTTVQAKSLTFMQYNVENFYDTKFDAKTDDYTFIPLEVKKSLPQHKENCNKIDAEFRRRQCLFLDWNESKFTKKILSVSKVIKAFDKSGTGPDIVVFQEVENMNVLNKLVTKGLDKLGYQSLVLIEGDDSRGIDVALISKFPVISSKRHALIMNGQTLDTRGILEVTLNVEGRTVVVFVNHWPSQSNPVQERIASAAILEKAANRMRADLIIAAGDFNSVKTDSPYPLHALKSFIDLEIKARETNPEVHPGTHFFRGEWTSLDKIFMHKNSTLLPEYSAFRIFHHAFMMKADNHSGEHVPVRFNHETGEGFSDHLPVGAEFKF
jgi:endonuclease/exonuclease/phosphatase family metal-dependent hydrolase